jgi:hypothetical protein
LERSREARYALRSERAFERLAIGELENLPEAVVGNIAACQTTFPRC